MSEKSLTSAQADEIEKIKRQWALEAKEYLENPSSGKAKLDGSDSSALAQIQRKYKKRIQEVIKVSRVHT